MADDRNGRTPPPARRAHPAPARTPAHDPAHAPTGTGPANTGATGTGPAGTEPATARSALRLRLILSALFLPVFTAATVGFALWSAHQGPGDSPGSGPLTVLAVVCGVLALAAALDLVRVTGRRRRERGTADDALDRPEDAIG